MCFAKAPKIKPIIPPKAAPPPAATPDTIEKAVESKPSKLDKKRTGTRKLRRGQSGLQLKKKSSGTSSGVSTNV